MCQLQQLAQCCPKLVRLLQALPRQGYAARQGQEFSTGTKTVLYRLLCLMMKADSCRSAFHERCNEAISDLCPGADAALKRPAETLEIISSAFIMLMNAALFKGSVGSRPIAVCVMIIERHAINPPHFCPTPVRQPLLFSSRDEGIEALEFVLGNMRNLFEGVSSLIMPSLITRGLAPMWTKRFVLQVHQQPANMCHGVVERHHPAPLAACGGEVRRKGQALLAHAGKAGRQLLRGSLLARMGHPGMLGVPLGRDGLAAPAITHRHHARLAAGRWCNHHNATGLALPSLPCFAPA